MLNVSIASYTFHRLLREEKMDVFGYLETIKFRYRLSAADIWNGFLESTDDEYLQKVRQALDERELLLANLAVDGAHIWDSDPSVRDRNYQTALQYLKAGHILGAQTVRIDVGGEGSGMSDEQFELVVRRYREYADIAAEYGFAVGPENHFGPSLVPENLVRIQEAVDHPAFGVLLHVRRWTEDQLNGDAMCAPFTVHTHFDARTTQEGVIDTLKTLKRAGYTGCYSIEDGSVDSDDYLKAESRLLLLRRALRGC